MFKLISIKFYLRPSTDPHSGGEKPQSDNPQYFMIGIADTKLACKYTSI